MSNLSINGGLNDDLKNVKYESKEATIFFKLKKTLSEATDKWLMPKGINVKVKTRVYRFKIDEKKRYTYRTREYNIIVSIFRNSCKVTWLRYNSPKKYIVVRKGTVTEVLYSNLTQHEKNIMSERYKQTGGDRDNTSADLTE